MTRRQLPEADRAEITRAVDAIVAICPTHTSADGVAFLDMDCGDCGSRQDAAAIYLLSRIEDARKAFEL